MAPASLNGALPELRAAYDKLAQYGKNHGIEFRIADFGALRTQADTTRIEGYRLADYNKALKAGAIRPDTTLQQFRPIAPFGKSYHNYGAAFDIWITRTPEGVESGDGRTEAPNAYTAKKLLGSLAPSLGLRWGGNFKPPSVDPPHFELAVTLDEAKKRYAAMSKPISAPVQTGTPPAALEYVAYEEQAGEESEYVGVYDGFETEDDASGSAMLLLGVLVIGTVVFALTRR